MLEVLLMYCTRREIIVVKIETRFSSEAANKEKYFSIFVGTI